MQIRPLQRPDLAKVRPLLDLAVGDKTHFSYPRFYKINDIFRELEYSIEFMATESLVIEENGDLEGLATYFWDEDEKYIQTTLLVIKNKAPCMAVGKIAHDTALKNPDGYEYNHDFCTE